MSGKNNEILYGIPMRKSDFLGFTHFFCPQKEQKGTVLKCNKRNNDKPNKRSKTKWPPSR